MVPACVLKDCHFWALIYHLHSNQLFAGLSFDKLSIILARYKEEGVTEPGHMTTPNAQWLFNSLFLNLIKM